MEGRSSVVLNTHAQQDLLAYCTRPVSVHLVMACTGCSFNSFCLFAQFKTTKSHENHVFLYPFSSMAISPQNNDFFIYFILVSCMGWQDGSWKDEKGPSSANTAAVSQPEAMLGKPTSTRPCLKSMAFFPSAQITAELVSADSVVLHF